MLKGGRTYGYTGYRQPGFPCATLKNENESTFPCDYAVRYPGSSGFVGTGYDNHLNPHQTKHHGGNGNVDYAKRDTSKQANRKADNSINKYAISDTAISNVIVATNSSPPVPQSLSLHGQPLPPRLSLI